MILEEPASSLQPDVCVTISESLIADAFAVRRDRAAIVERVRRENPPWSDEDVHWSVEGMAQMDAAPFARRFAALANEPPPDGSERIVSAAPDAHVIAALPESGSAPSRRDRDRLSTRLPAGHLIEPPGRALPTPATRPTRGSRRSRRSSADHEVELSDALGVGDQLDLEDLPVLVREAEDDARPSALMPRRGRRRRRAAPAGRRARSRENVGHRGRAADLGARRLRRGRVRA